MQSRSTIPGLLALLAGAALSAPALAATITVAAGEVAVQVNGQCSLREAILNAEADTDLSGGDCAAGSGHDTLELAAGSTYTLADAYPGAQSTGLPLIRTQLTIRGNGAIIQRDPALFNNGACSGGATFRLLQVGDIGQLTLFDATLRYGCATQGGALFNHGTVVLDGVRLLDNEASSSGGAVHNDHTLTLLRSTVSGNRVLGGAGGAITSTRTLQVTESTISNNTAPGAGGGMYTAFGTAGDGAIQITNSTLSGNTAQGLGGAARFSDSTTTLTHSTVANNHGASGAAAATDGSGLFRNGSGTMALNGTLLATQVNGSNCRGNHIAVTGSAADDGSCAGALLVASPMLGPLADNGGPTYTHALLFGSPLIDAGSNATASGLTVDQRGFARIANANVDFGALEYNGGYDQDGVTDAIENQVPSASGAGVGDGNGDSIPDRQQGHVASLPMAQASQGFATVVSTGNRPLSAVAAVARPDGVPAEFLSPYGAFSFTASGLPVGSTETFELFIPYSRGIVGALKRNRLTGAWENVATSVTHIGTVKTRITFTLIDGGVYDQDAAANGQIVDPVVPYASVTAVPTLSQWGVLMLAALALSRRRAAAPR